MSLVGGIQRGFIFNRSSNPYCIVIYSGVLFTLSPDPLCTKFVFESKCSMVTELSVSISEATQRYVVIV